MTEHSERGAVRVFWVLLAVAFGFVAWMVLDAAGSKDDKPAPPSQQELLELLQAWNAGNSALDHFEFKEAAERFRKVTDRLPDQADAWVNLGLSTMNQDHPEAFTEAEGLLAKALEIDSGNPNANFCLGILLKHLGRFDEAEPCFRRVLERDPHDATANYYLATLLLDRKATAEAEKHLRLSMSSEPHQASAIKNLFGLYYQTGREGEAEPLVETFRKLTETETGNQAGIVYSEMGRYGSGVRPFPLPLPDGAETARTLEFKARVIGGGEPSPAGDARPATLPIPGGRTPAMVLTEQLLPLFGPGASIADVDADGDLDLWIADARSLGRLLLNAGGEFEDASQAWGLTGTGRSVSACFADYDQDGRPDLYVCCAGPNRLLRNEGTRFVDVTAATGTSGGNLFSSQAVMSDLDADGDVDLFVAHLCSLDLPATDEDRTWPQDLPGAPDQLFNNNRDGTFEDITARTGTSGGDGRSISVVAADLDGDHDADLVVTRLLDAPLLLRNDRIGRFAPSPLVAQGWSATGGTGTLVGDWDGDGHLDLMILGTEQPASPLRNEGRLAFTTVALETSAATGCALDADNDGDQDLALLPQSGDPRLLIRRRDGTYAQDTAALAALRGSSVRALLPADLNGDGALDLLATRPGAAPLILDGTRGNGHWLAVALKGLREEGKMRANTGGIGARVTVVAGTSSQIQEVMTAGGVLGGPSPCLHFGLDGHTQVDYLAVNWPDDLLQGETEVSADGKTTITQVYRKSSSCPLLFAWDGERMAFVTDFLGVGGLGFFLSPGVYAPPDPTELVKIPALVARNGCYRLSIHEPMEEILYLDEVKLLVVDHPEGVEVWPDERLCIAGPAPDGRLLAIKTAERMFPERLDTLDGAGDASCLVHADRIYQPGVRPDRRFIGFAERQEIVVDFGAALGRTDPARSLWLFLDGWVEYPYSHVNFAAAQAGLALRGLSLDAEVHPGEWREILPEFGYPAGMPRVMTVDVSALPRDGTGRLRLRTNVELYVDRLWLAEDLGSSVLEIRELVAATAELRKSGYPREYSPDGKEPLLYDYALMDPAIAYKTMAGEYTAFGDVRLLLEQPEDCYVIVGRAEEVSLEFEAPPPPASGRARSFVLKSDGYCKDMDLYTAFPHTVEPLPFHGMSGYPYPPTERYPDDELHRNYRKRWNTRKLLGHESRGGALGR